MENVLIGKTLNQAQFFCDEAGTPHRVTKLDGNDLIVTCDYVPERVNFEVEKDIIINVTFG